MVGSEGFGEPLGICQKSEKACGSVPPALHVLSVSAASLRWKLNRETRPMSKILLTHIPGLRLGTSQEGTVQYFRLTSAKAIIVVIVVQG